MDAAPATATPATPAAPRFNPLLPYFAVFRTDLRQTFHGWLFRLWVIVAVVAAVGYGLYKFGIHREVGLVQSASEQTGVLLGTVGVLTLAFVSLIAVHAISGERGTVADSILSRGISRYQYFAAKWHARTVVLLLAFAVLSAGVLTAYHYLLEPDLSLAGCAVGIAVAVAVLAAVIAWGVTVGAMSNGTVIGVTLFWLVLFGGLFLLSFLPAPFPTGSGLLSALRTTLRGHYDPTKVAQVIGLFLLIALAGGVTGLLGYSKKDV
jgi:ABC-2 type transport system permease protein